MPRFEQQQEEEKEGPVTADHNEQPVGDIVSCQEIHELCENLFYPQLAVMMYGT